MAFSNSPVFLSKLLTGFIVAFYLHMKTFEPNQALQCMIIEHAGSPVVSGLPCNHRLVPFLPQMEKKRSCTYRTQVAVALLVNILRVQLCSFKCWGLIVQIWFHLRGDWAGAETELCGEVHCRVSLHQGKGQQQRSPPQTVSPQRIPGVRVFSLRITVTWRVKINFKHISL